MFDLYFCCHIPLGIYIFENVIWGHVQYSYFYRSSKIVPVHWASDIICNVILKGCYNAQLWMLFNVHLMGDFQSCCYVEGSTLHLLVPLSGGSYVMPDRGTDKYNSFLYIETALKVTHFFNIGCVIIIFFFYSGSLCLFGSYSVYIVLNTENN